jgi:uncharacterized membrane protein
LAARFLRKLEAAAAENAMTPIPNTSRLEYLDWMRGMACLLMFQAHCYDSWLTPAAKQTKLYEWSQIGGTLPAPLFLFLSGISVVLVTAKLQQKGAHRNVIAKTTILRGAEVFGFALLFRLQEFVLGIPISLRTDLLRVDILNVLGLSIIAMGVLCWVTATPSGNPQQLSTSPPSSTGANPRAIGDAKSAIATAFLSRTALASLAIATLIALATPPLWTTRRPTSLPWWLESYINGVHTFTVPQTWLFPLFPWAAFAFAGLAAGCIFFWVLARRSEASVLAYVAASGVAAFALALLFDALPIHFYSATSYDYWHTSPNFLLARCGVLLVMMGIAYAWCRWVPGWRGFSPITQMGRTSLLIYWAHVEFVYGRLSILPKGRCGVPAATVGLAVITVAMLALSVWRTRSKQRASKASRPNPLATAAIAES